MLRKSASFQNPPGFFTQIINLRGRIEKGRRSPNLTEARARSARTAEVENEVTLLHGVRFFASQANGRTLAVCLWLLTLSLGARSANLMSANGRKLPSV
jgi:hypothetical protein